MGSVAGRFGRPECLPAPAEGQRGLFSGLIIRARRTDDLALREENVAVAPKGQTETIFALGHELRFLKRPMAYPVMHLRG